MTFESNTKTRRFAMKCLFKEPEAHKIIKTFETALEAVYGCDAHFVYDVNYNHHEVYAYYAYTEINAAFIIYLHTLSELPESLFSYLHDNVLNKDLFLHEYALCV